MAELNLNEIALRITTGDKELDRQFWATKTSAERLAAVEFLRRLQFGKDATTARLSRVLTVTDQS